MTIKLLPGFCFLYRTAMMGDEIFFVWTVSSLELEHRLHKILHRLARRICRRLVVARVRIDLHAGVLVGERLTGFGIDDRAEWLLLELASAHALRTLRHGRRLVAERIVVAVVRVGIFGELHVASRRAQAFEIRAARR